MIHETRHEGTALTMAEGWARATGQPGICTVTQGPGLTQLGTSLTVAARGQDPDGRLRRRYRARRPRRVQQFDQQRFVEATEAGFVPHLERPASADDAVRHGVLPGAG